MQLPLKPLLCRHDFYWSERHGSDRCRRCGKRRPAEALDVLIGEPMGVAGMSRGATGSATAPTARRAARSPESMRPGAGALQAQAQERRDRLPGLLERLVAGVQPTREEAIDAVLAVIEDAHSADPLLFGGDAAGHFARLHEARSTPRC